jgi:chromate transporter
MILLELFLQFLKIGAFAFGGAYGAIPLIRETVLSQGWMDEAQLMNLLGISESTPGPIMVNTATMAGFDQAGVPGALVATLGVVLPSFLIMLIIPRLQKRWAGHKVIRMAMRGIKPCLAGVIVATGIHLLIQIVSSSEQNAFDWKMLLMIAVLIAVSVLFRKYKKKPISPILLILLSAVIGILFL